MPEQEEEERAMSNIMPKLKAAYEHGRMDYHAGFSCSPKTPLEIYYSLNKTEKAFIAMAWVDGWHEESQTGVRA